MIRPPSRSRTFSSRSRPAIEKGGAIVDGDHPDHPARPLGHEIGVLGVELVDEPAVARGLALADLVDEGLVV